MLPKGILRWFRRYSERSLSSVPLPKSRELRGPLSLGEGDQLRGRERDLQELYTIVANSDVRFGVLYGESGCGKTSLLRAGLIPALRQTGFVSVYIKRPTKDPLSTIREALTKELGRVQEVGPNPLRTKFRQNLDQYFSVEELRTLCFDLGLEYDGLSGGDKENKINALLLLLENCGRVPELVKWCSERRPKVSWDQWTDGAKQLGDKPRKLLSMAAPRERKTILILDQFEEYFWPNSVSCSHMDDLIEWISQAVEDESEPVTFLVSIQAQSIFHLFGLRNISELISVRTRYELRNFSTDQAKEVLSAAADADKAQFQPALIQKVVEDLETDGFVRPVELQIIGWQLCREGILTKSQYLSCDGKKGVLSSFVNNAIEGTGKEKTARAVLRQMCAEERIETKSPEDLSIDDIMRNLGESELAAVASAPQEVAEVLKKLTNNYILIHTEEDKYNLAHDYLALYVHRATEGVETPKERADRLLERYAALHDDDPRSHIPFQHVRNIRRYASSEKREKERKLLEKSIRAFYASVAGIIAALILVASVVAGYFLYQKSRGGIWTQYTFKETGYVSHIAVQPGNEHVLWAVVDGERYGRILHRSEDGGNRWESVSETTPDRISQMVVGLGDHDQPLVYMGNHGKGVYVFDWSMRKIGLRNSGLHSLSVSELALDPEDHRTVYLGTGDKRGIYVSSNFGNSWQQIGGDALGDKSIVSIVLLAHPRRVYVLTDEDLVWVGDGRTAEWKLASPGGCSPEYAEAECDPSLTLCGKGHITNLAVDANNRRVYAATAARWIGVLDDSTQQWTGLSIPQAEPHEYLNGIIVTGGDEPLLYASAWRRGGASLYQSRDGGQSWDLVTAPQIPRSGWSQLVSDPTSSDRLYVASDLGAVRTINGGRDWSMMPLRFPPAPVSNVYVSSAVGASLYLAQLGAVYRGNSADAQSTWTRADGGLDAVTVRDLVGDPRDSDVLYAGVYRPRQWSVFATRDRGQHWELLGLPVADFRDDDTVSLALAVFDERHLTLYAGTNGSGVLRVELGPEQQQAEWSHCLADVRNVQKVLVPSWNPRMAYALGDGRTIVGTTDAGLSWSTINKLSGTAPVTWLEAGSTPDTLYVSTKGDGVLQTMDGGRSWRNISARLPDRNVISLAVDGGRSDILYVLTEAGVVYRSANAGGDWESIRENLDITDAQRLIIHRHENPKVPRLILAGGSGVYFYMRNKPLGFEIPW